jgi:hypothetical protein
MSGVGAFRAEGGRAHRSEERRFAWFPELSRVGSVEQRPQLREDWSEK